MDKNKLIERINFLQNGQRKMLLSLEPGKLIDTQIIDLYRREIDLCIEELVKMSLKK